MKKLRLTFLKSLVLLNILSAYLIYYPLNSLANKTCSFLLRDEHPLADHILYGKEIKILLNCENWLNSVLEGECAGAAPRYH